MHVEFTEETAEKFAQEAKKWYFAKDDLSVQMTPEFMAGEISDYWVVQVSVSLGKTWCSYTISFSDTSFHSVYMTVKAMKEAYAVGVNMGKAEAKTGLYRMIDKAIG